LLRGVLRRDVAVAARQHDRLVVAAHFAAGGKLEAAEVARKVRPPEFVVVCGPTDRAVDHDLQGRGDAAGLAVIRFPRAPRIRKIQVRDREAGEARLGRAADAGRALVANRAARAGACARVWRDRWRMVVRLALPEL